MLRRGFRAQGGTRTRKPCGIRPSNVRVYQFHHLGLQFFNFLRNKELPFYYLWRQWESNPRPLACHASTLAN